MHIAVTGGNGDLGKALCRYLLAQGYTVVSIDRGPPATRTPARAMSADLRDFGQCVGVLQGCTALIHLAAHRAPGSQPDQVVYVENTSISYNILYAAATLGITRICLASSINAIGGAFSQRPRYDYFPLNEAHPTYSEDPYSLSKWVLEQQADAFARRHPALRIASLRFHWILASYAEAVERSSANPALAARHLWAYTTIDAACRACLLAVTADFSGHHALYITAPRTTSATPSLGLAHTHYPDTPISGDLSGHSSFFDCSKAAHILGWQHE